jgi:hypothetical protein
MRLMRGVIIALVASLAQAGSSVPLKSLSFRIDAISVNMMRLWVGSFALLAVVIFSGKCGDILQTPIVPILVVVASVGHFCVILIKPLVSRHRIRLPRRPFPGAKSSQNDSRLGCNRRFPVKIPGPKRRYFFVGGVAGAAGLNASFHLICRS